MIYFNLNYICVLITGLLFMLSGVGLFVRTLTNNLYNAFECGAGVVISVFFLLMGLLWCYEFCNYCYFFWREYKRGLACF